MRQDRTRRYPPVPIPDTGNPEHRFHSIAQADNARYRTTNPKPELLLQLLALNGRGCPIEVAHYNGQKQTGILSEVREEVDSVALYFGQRRPIIFCLGHAEWSPTKGRLSISLNAKETGDEYGYSIHINTVLSASTKE